MPAARFTNLLIVVAVRLLAPLVLGFFPLLRLFLSGLEIDLQRLRGRILWRKVRACEPPQRSNFNVRRSTDC
jgi:hypothetical protein